MDLLDNRWISVERSDLNKLHQQKLALVNGDFGSSEIEGLINFLDHLLDEAEVKGLFKYPEVIGSTDGYKARSIAIIWTIEDVQEERPDLSEEQAMKVLEIVRRNHNAEVGVNWEVIKTTANVLFPGEVE